VSIVKKIVIIGISAAVFLYDKIKQGVLAALMKNPSARCVILYYHDIPKKEQGRFAFQMDLLLRYCLPVSCSTIPAFEAGKRYAGITFDDGFISYKDVALPELELRRIPSSIFIPTQYLGSAPGWLQNSEERLMTPEEIREIVQSPLVTIGSHGIKHGCFTNMSNDEVKTEFFESKVVLEKITGNRITIFSFPHGDYVEDHVHLAQSAGYEKVFSILPYCAFRKEDEYLIGRVKVYTTDWNIEFMLKINGAYRWLPFAYQLKKMLFRCMSFPKRAHNN